MSHLINNQQKLNDIIFADRNKAYGAYALRSDYGNTIFKSISFMLIGVGSIMSIAFYLSNRNNQDPNLAGQIIIHDSIYVIPVNVEKDDPATDDKKKTDPPPLDKTKPLASEKPFVMDSVVETTKTTTTEIGVSTLSTTAGETGSVIATETKPGKGKGSPDTTSKKIKEGFEVDSAPEFEGGLVALYRFVSKHLKYPNWASSEGKEGIVYVKFVVDETGKVGTLSLLNSAGYGMDDEALRVVSLIPKFKSPAKVNGEAVKVYYQIPIRFRFKY